MTASTPTSCSSSMRSARVDRAAFGGLQSRRPRGGRVLRHAGRPRAGLLVARGRRTCGRPDSGAEPVAAARGRTHTRRGLLLHGPVGFALHGKTVGVIRTGMIGRAFGRIMAGFVMQVL